MSALATKDGAERWVSWVLKRVAQNLERDGTLKPIAFLIITRNPQTGEVGEPDVVMVVPQHFEDEKDKDAFADVLHTVARRGAAIGYLFASEAWVAVGEANETIEDVFKYGSLEKHPKSREVVVVGVEHQALGKRMYMGNILRLKKRVRLAGWQTMDHRFEGRFAGMIEVDEAGRDAGPDHGSQGGEDGAA